MAEKLPCPLCHEPLDVELDKRGNPYLSCFGCGVQLFIRRKKAIAVFFERHGQAYPPEFKAWREKNPAETPAPAMPATTTAQPKKEDTTRATETPKRRAGLIIKD